MDACVVDLPADGFSFATTRCALFVNAHALLVERVPLFSSVQRFDFIYFFSPTYNNAHLGDAGCTNK